MFLQSIRQLFKPTRTTVSAACFVPFAHVLELCLIGCLLTSKLSCGH